MTTTADVVNRALQYIGSRDSVSVAELAANSSNEAIQANLSLNAVRDELLRMAPWDCAFTFENLTYITSLPGTPENTTAATSQWVRGQPLPPWVYEYQYPVDCLRACWIVPTNSVGFPGVPLTPVVNVAAPYPLPGMPVKFRIGTDLFFSLDGVTLTAGGINYNPNDIITLEGGADGDPPIGAPAKVRVLTTNPATGEILTCEIVNSVIGATQMAGSYYRVQSGTIAQGSATSILYGNVPGTGTGTGATFTASFSAVPTSQRVVLTNQEDATLAYIKQITDPNIMDPLFLDAWSAALATRICIPLNGDKKLAQLALEITNNSIAEARKADGNEGLTINDITPDWIRARGITFPPGFTGPFGAFDWGPGWVML